MKTKKKNKRKQRHGARGDSTTITLTSMECWTCRVGNYNSAFRSRGPMHFTREREEGRERERE